MIPTFPSYRTFIGHSIKTTCSILSNASPVSVLVFQLKRANPASDARKQHGRGVFAQHKRLPLESMSFPEFARYTSAP